MKRTFYILIFLVVSLSASAQKVIRFVDADLDSPIAYVLVADKDSVIARANEYGAAFIPKRTGKIIFVHDAYERVEMDYNELPEVLVMQRRTYDIDEVVVVGQGQSKVDKHAAEIKEMKTEMELQQAGAGNGNLLGWLNDILNNRKTKKERKLERTQQALDEFDKAE